MGDTKDGIRRCLLVLAEYRGNDWDMEMLTAILKNKEY